MRVGEYDALQLDQLAKMELLSIRQAAAYFSMGRDTVSKMAKQAGAARKIGHSVKVDRAQLSKWIKDNCTMTA